MSLVSGTRVLETSNSYVFFLSIQLSFSLFQLKPPARVPADTPPEAEPTECFLPYRILAYLIELGNLFYQRQQLEGMTIEELIEQGDKFKEAGTINLAVRNYEAVLQKCEYKEKRYVWIIYIGLITRRLLVQILPPQPEENYD